MGTPEFARIILARLYEEGFLIKAVFAQPDKPSGRGQKVHAPPVAAFAREKGLDLYQPSKLRNPEVSETVEKIAPDFIVVAAYGKILPQRLLNVAKVENLNVHASLLPCYRGAAPINYALLEGREKTGVSIMRVVREMDAGPVYAKEEVGIEPEDNALTLSERLAHRGAGLLIQTIQRIVNEGLKPVEQEHERATFAPKITRQLAPIDWQKTAWSIFNQVRALIPWPVAHTTIAGKTLRIFATGVLNEKSGRPPGTVTHIAPAGLTVATGTTDLLVKEVQLEGKRRMNAFDLANGLRLKAGEIKLGC